MIYLDNNATTQPFPSVIEAMLPFLSDCFFNASSNSAAFTGANKPRQDAAAAMVRLLNAEESDCIAFTSGATESNNWLFSSVVQTHRQGRIIVSAIEHPSVAKAAEALRRKDYEILEVPVDINGLVRMDALAEMLSETVILVSIMAANNETGVLQPLNAIGKLIRDRALRAIFHTDATQAVGKISVDLIHEWPEVDMLSFSAHKFHGPKGVGGLYVRPGIEIEPMIRGGEQERGLRSGTTNTPGLAGLASAARHSDPKSTIASIAEVRDLFENELLNAIPTTVIHSRGAPRLSNTSCFSIPGTVGDDLAQSLAIEGIIVGTGSACSAGALHPPKAVLALGTDYQLARGTLRVSLSVDSCEQDVLVLTTKLQRLVQSQFRSVDSIKYG